MAILWGDTGKVTTGVLKSFTFQMANPREVALVSSTLPNTEGTTNQVSFTIQQSDLPTISPNPVSFKYLALIVVSGKAGATSSTINYRIFKNGTSIATSNMTCSANQYWTQNHWRWFDVSVGDILEVRCWANVTDATIDYCAIQIYPANIMLSKSNQILRDFNISSILSPILNGAGVRTTTIASNNFQVYMHNLNNINQMSVSNTGTGVIGALLHPTSGVIKMQSGDAFASNTSARTDATRIFYERNYVPGTILFREVLR